MPEIGAYVMTVRLYEDGDLWYANSQDLRGLHVCGSTQEETCERVLKAIKAIYKHGRQMKVEVTPVAETDSFELPQVCGSKPQFVVHRAAA